MSELAALREEMGEVKDKLGDLAETMAAVKAVTDELGKRRDSEVSALWQRMNERSTEIDGRVRVVEINYATKAEIAAANQRLLDVEKQVWRIVGIGVVIQFVGLVGIAALVKFGG